MDPRLTCWLDQAQQLLKDGCVKEVEFADATYQVEVLDLKSNQTFWPLLHFTQKGQLSEALCGCELSDGCVHLAAAYLKVTQTADKLPLHSRFKRSFFYQLFEVLVEHVGYEESVFEQINTGHFYISSPSFTIQAKTDAIQTKLDQLIQHRSKQTPENSIQFSDISQEELSWWKEGRPSANLRFSLSIFSDLAKWLYIENLKEPFQISYEEDTEGLPTQLRLSHRLFDVTYRASKEDLISLIPSFDTVDFPLKVYKQVTGKIHAMRYNPATFEIHIEHAEHAINLKGAIALDGWLYKPGEGFYTLERKSFFDRDIVNPQEVGKGLSEHADIIGQFLPVHIRSTPISYCLTFDEAWNLHIHSYLFEKGDLETSKGHLIDQNWAFLHQNGFFHIRDALFAKAHHVVLKEEISDFINHHRIWLGGQKGFQPHLASLESPITYELTAKLHFKAKYAVEANQVGEACDFEEWVYYKGEGFFAKQSSRIGHIVKPGLSVEKQHIASFIKQNREELEAISRFFAFRLPLKERGVKIQVNGKHQLVIEPFFSLKEEFAQAKVEFFEDFIYWENEGFYEIPMAMRLPEPYQEKVIIEASAVSHFLTEDLPKLERHILHRDVQTQIPHKLHVHLNYLVRNKGGVKAELELVTEYGAISIGELINNLPKKATAFFTAAGLLDLQQENLAWIRHLKLADGDSRCLEMNTLDFIKLDAHLSFLLSTTPSNQQDVTKRLLKELREFRVEQAPVLSGLSSQLRLYQQTGLQWLWFLYKNGLSGLLCDDMGLGKTHQSMALMAAISNQENVEANKFLVICPTSVIYHWQEKIEHFLPRFKVYTFHGMKRQLPDLKTGGVLLTTYGIVRLEQESLKKIAFDLAIYDEVQVAKNPSSQVHGALKTLTTRMRLGLSGTPIENNLRELKALFDVVLPGYMPSESKYRDYFILPIERDRDEEKKAILSQLIKPFVLRRRKTEVLDELPAKSEDNAYCDLSVQQQQLYAELLSQSRQELLSTLKNQTEEIPYIHVFALLSRLKQICNHPALVHNDIARYEEYSSGKWDLFIELLHEVRHSEQKVVIFSQYLKMLDIIELYVKQQGWGYAQIRGDTLDRKTELKRFQENPECVVFIGSLQAAGLGIDLTAASVVILYDRWWNAARENQAIDRVHRIGQKWPVQVFKLIAKGTIEEKIDRMIARKGQLLEEIIASDEQGVIKSFSRSELIELLSYSVDENLTESL